MADFCSLRISTVTGQVSFMPQTAVVQQPAAVRMGSHCIRLDRRQEIRSEIYTRATDSLVTLCIIYDMPVPGMDKPELYLVSNYHRIRIRLCS